MSNRGWENGGNGGESVSSTTRTTGGGTATGEADQFLRGSNLASPGDNSGDTMGDRADLFEPPGQLTTDH
jgi:hypothetical protein